MRVKFVVLLVLAMAFGAGTAAAGPASDSPPPPVRGVPGGPHSAPPGSGAAPQVCTNILQDGGFEGGSPNAYWTEYSLNFGTPLCEPSFCGSAGQTARSGLWWLWFGGIDAYEEGWVTQTLTIPNGAAQIRFWLWSDTPTAPETDYLQVQIDDTAVYSITSVGASGYVTWTEVVINVNAYANGLPHDVEFYSEGGLTPGNFGNFHIDDVSLCHTVPTSVALTSLDAVPQDPPAGAAARLPIILLVALLALAAASGTVALRRARSSSV